MKKENNFLNIDEVINITGLSDVVIQDFVNCGDIKAYGSKKELFRLCDINNLMGETADNERLAIANSHERRSNIPCSIDDIKESEWIKMVKNGNKEHTPYFDKQKKKWCIALSLGKNEDGKRIRKIISGLSQPELWQNYSDYLMKNEKEIAPISVNSVFVENGLSNKLNIATYTPNQDILFSEQYMEFLNGLEHGITNRTFSDYIHTSKYIIDQLGHFKMYEINRKVIETFLKDLALAKYPSTKNGIHDTYYSQRTLKTTFDLLHRFIKSCADESSDNPIFKKDFMANMKKPRSNALKRDEIKPYTDDEIKNILNAVKCNKKIYCWILILATTGVRPSEALALKSSDIDYYNKTISFTKTIGKEADYEVSTLKRTSPYRAIVKDLKNVNSNTTNSNFQARTLTVCDEVLVAIKELIQETENNDALMANKKQLKTTDFIFTGPNGDLRVYADYYRDYIRLLKKAKIPSAGTNPYRFRHTVCTKLFREGINLKVIQMHMGDNTSDMILKVYANLDRNDLLAASSKLADTMGEVCSK